MRLCDWVIVRDPELEIDQARLQPRIIDEPLVPKLGIRNKLEDAVPGMNMGSKDSGFLQRACQVSGLDVVADLERPQPKQHEACGNFRERALQSEADRKPDGTERRPARS